jgi:hypothetical protein
LVEPGSDPVGFRMLGPQDPRHVGQESTVGAHGLRRSCEVPVEFRKVGAGQQGLWMFRAEGALPKPQ